MITALVVVSVALAGAVGGLIYFARAALSRADKLGEAAVLAIAAIAKLEKKLAEANAKRVAAEANAKRLEVINANPPSRTAVSKALAETLDLLPVADALRIRRQLHQDRNRTSPGSDPESVSGPSGPADIAELE